MNEKTQASKVEPDSFGDWYKLRTGKMPDPYDDSYCLLRDCWDAACECDESEWSAAYDDGYSEGYEDGKAEA